MKRLYLLMVVLLISTMTLSCFSAEKLSAETQMTDVDYETELGKSIDKLVKGGVVNGIPQPDGSLKYEPDNPVTRAEFCKMVNTTFGYEVAANNIFTDVYKDQWYYIYILPAIHEGYIQGYGNGKFGPTDYITREQVCVILSKIVNKTSDKKVDIKDKVSDWAKPYVENMIGLGYMSLEKDGAFRSTENMTRGELAFALDDFVKVKETVSDKETSSGSKPSGGSSSSSKPSGSGSSGGSRPSGGTSSGSSSSGSSDSGTEDVGTSGSGSSTGNSGNNSSSDGSGDSSSGQEPESPAPEVEYTITYELNGIGELPEGAKTIYKASVLPYTLPVLKGTDDYVFDGWYTDSSFPEGTEALKKIESDTAENLVLYAKWKDRYTQEERETSEKIYENLEFAISDIEENEELEMFEFDEKGQTIFDIVKNCISSVYALRDEGVVVSNEYVRGKYYVEISQITDILDGMTPEERQSFEDQMLYLNTATLTELRDLFDVNINYGK